MLKTPETYDRECDGTSCLEKFDIRFNATGLPIGETPSYILEGLNGVCTGGSAMLTIFSNKRRVAKNDLVVIFPYQLVSLTDVSRDFTITYFNVPKTLFMDTLGGIYRLTPHFFFYTRRHFCFQMSQTESQRFVHLCNVLAYRSDPRILFFRRESVINLLRVFYWDIYVQFKNNPSGAGSNRYTHKEKMAFNFYGLVTEHHAENRDVGFYADKLCISPKYLTMVVKQVSGRSAKEWIVDYTILEIKALLRETDLDIKDVVSRTRFGSQSLMSRFFRKHTGMTPSQYRESIIK